MNQAVESLTKKGSLFFSEPASYVAMQLDGLFYFILFLSFLFFIGIFGVAGYFIYKYRSTDLRKIPSKQFKDSTKLELTWTIIPVILTMIIFVWGFKDFIAFRVAPDYSYTINVTGKKWFWVFDYPDTGKTVMNDLVVPVDTPIKLVMSSEDVLHSFFIPNMRIKRDVIPNRYTALTFTANRAGSYTIFCTEYCGDGHSAMLGNLKVMPKAEFASWQDSGDAASDDVPLAQLGAKLYEEKLCSTCHSIDGSPMSGPSWQGLYGATREFTNAESVVADENYLRESIVEPGAKVVAGYMNIMPAYAGLLSDREINALIAYIKELQ